MDEVTVEDQIAKNTGSLLLHGHTGFAAVRFALSGGSGGSGWKGVFTSSVPLSFELIRFILPAELSGFSSVVHSISGCTLSIQTCNIACDTPSTPSIQFSLADASCACLTIDGLTVEQAITVTSSVLICAV